MTKFKKWIAGAVITLGLMVPAYAQVSRISTMLSGSPLQGTDTMLILRGTDNLKITASDVKTYTNNTLPLIQKTSVTTASDGSFVWTYPTAFSSTPTISVTANGAISSVWNAQITSKNSTTATIQVNRSVPSAIALLGLTIGVVSTSPQTTVDIVAIGS